ncbi:MAG TPA: DUF1841 domain-containing protein [Myxococcaceae bacterium]|jgi:hypothetical protein
MKRYDPDQELDPRQWLALTEEQRRALALAVHEPLPPGHPTVPSARFHAAAHVMVETQLARQEIPEANQAFQRLRAAGLGRHRAIHALADVALAEMTRMVEARTPFDRLGYVERLKSLTVVGPGPGGPGASNQDRH